MVLASAQICTTNQDAESNLDQHYNLINLAAEKGAQLIVFPEMSITGYVRETAAGNLFTPDDSRLNQLKAISAEKQIIVVAGAPVLINNDLFIGSLVIKPDQSVMIYTKQFLHTGEELFFKSSFDYNPYLLLDNEKIYFAICADTTEPLHAQNAAQNGATLYIASICFSKEGLPSGYKNLSNYAKNHDMNVLMSNFCGKVYRYQCGGQSGFWDNKGKLVAGLNDTDNGLLIIKKNENNWAGYSLVV
ncbi:MAG: carbon-nitrogen hydrolase family protein [Spirochaetes bacterium]|nr:carbon-nitrogen hydrolase family protein [Spirochaetota bacterium]MBN2770256.1 carbon-nitrogen hydrolase family protein [Spirochaetota bacterium]